MAGSYVSVAYLASSTERVQNSPDAITWTARSSAADGGAGGGYCIAASPNEVVALVRDSTGVVSVAIRSTDGGTTWTSNAVPQHFQYSAVAYGGGVFVALDPLGKVIRSTDDGITWSDVTTLAANDGGWQALAYGNGLFVAVGADDASGAVVATSPTGATWTTRTAPVKLWQGVCYGGGQFVAVGGPNPIFSGLTGVSCAMTSPDGVTWTSRTPAGASSYSWRAVAHDGAGLYVAVALNSAGTLMTSPDGVAWSTISVSGTTACYGICHGGGKFVISQDDALSAGHTIVTSPDGATWTVQTAAIPDRLTATVYFDPCALLGIACGSPPDGTIGTPYTHTFPATGGANLFFSIVTGALPPGLSLDPATGVVSGTPTTDGPYSFTIQVQFAQIMAAGDDGSFTNSKVVITSNDGTAWTRQTTAITDSGWSVCYSADLSMWVVGTDDAGTTDQVQTSPDGSSGSWTGQSSPANSSGSVRRIISGPGKLVAIYAKSGTGHIMTSTDSGVTWVEQFLPDGSLTIDAAIAYSPELGLYAVGEVGGATHPGFAGACATSPDAVTWTIRPKTSNMGRVGGMAWGNGTFVLMGGPDGSGEHLYVSTDGVTWTRILSDPGGTAQSWAGVTFANGIFVAVSDDISTDPGNQAVYSGGGTTWTKVATPGSGKKWQAVAFDGTVWVACDGGFGSTQPLMISTDNGVTWTLVPALGFSYGFMNGIAFGVSGACAATAPCSITIGGGSTFGNIWGGGSGQSAGNHW